MNKRIITAWQGHPGTVLPRYHAASQGSDRLSVLEPGKTEVGRGGGMRLLDPSIYVYMCPDGPMTI